MSCNPSLHLPFPSTSTSADHSMPSGCHPPRWPAKPSDWVDCGPSVLPGWDSAMQLRAKVPVGGGCGHQLRRIQGRPTPPCSALGSLPALQTSSTSQAVLEWATGQRASDLPVSVTDMGPGRGRGLVAKEDIPPGQAILSVPFQRVYMSKPEDELELHWSADMAWSMLWDRHACSAGRAQAGANSNVQQQQQWCTWLASLPSEVRTPLGFDAEALAAVRDPVVAAEVRSMQECMRASFRVLEAELTTLGYGWEDFLGAVQLLHSRCFFTEGRHLAVPGIDMCNHTSQPSAQVEVQHSPGAVQGLAALEEVADPATFAHLASEPSRIELVAGAAGISRGEEVTISYGGWPDTAFFLLFGFLPTDNPRNSVVLFNNVEEVATTLIHHLTNPNPNPNLTLAPDHHHQQQQQLTATTTALHAALDLTAALSVGRERLLGVVQGVQGTEELVQGLLSAATTAEQLQGGDDDDDDDDDGDGAEGEGLRELSRLVITADGWDERLETAVNVACGAVILACDHALESGATSLPAVGPGTAEAISELRHAACGLTARGDAFQQVMRAVGVRKAVRAVVVRGCLGKLAALDGNDRGNVAGGGGGVVGRGVSSSSGSAEDVRLAEQFTMRQVQLLKLVLGKLG